MMLSSLIIIYNRLRGFIENYRKRAFLLQPFSLEPDYYMNLPSSVQVKGNYVKCWNQNSPVETFHRIFFRSLWSSTYDFPKVNKKVSSPWNIPQKTKIIWHTFNVATEKINLNL